MSVCVVHLYLCCGEPVPSDSGCQQQGDNCQSPDLSTATFKMGNNPKEEGLMVAEFAVTLNLKRVEWEI